MNCQPRSGAVTEDAALGVGVGLAGMREKVRQPWLRHNLLTVDLGDHACRVDVRALDALVLDGHLTVLAHSDLHPFDDRIAEGVNEVRDQRIYIIQINGHNASISPCSRARSRYPVARQ